MPAFGPKLVVQTILTSANDTSAKEELGAVVITSDGKLFQYINAKSALSQGFVVGGDSSASGTATYTVSPTIARCAGNRAVGVAVGTISAGNYGWVQVKGRNNHVKTDGSVGVGGIRWGTNKTAASASATTAVTKPLMGLSRKADSGSIATFVELDCLLM